MKRKNWKTFVLLTLFFGVLTPITSFADETWPKYPWFTWGEVGQYIEGRNNPGSKVAGYIEQGVDWFRLGTKGPTFNTFVGVYVSTSTKKEYWWDNYYGPWFGIKFKLPLTISDKAGGELSVGIRGEYYQYLGGVGSAAPYKNDLRGVAFVQWYFGGDWSK